MHPVKDIHRHIRYQKQIAWNVNKGLQDLSSNSFFFYPWYLFILEIQKMQMRKKDEI